MNLRKTINLIKLIKWLSRHYLNVKINDVPPKPQQIMNKKEEEIDEYQSVTYAALLWSVCALQPDAKSIDALSIRHLAFVVCERSLNTVVIRYP